MKSLFLGSLFLGSVFLGSVFLGSVFLGGCGQGLNIKVEEPNAYVMAFITEAWNRGVVIDQGLQNNLNIEFVPKIEDANVVGFCQAYSNSDRRDIKISLEYWDTFDDYRKEVLFFHELAHCWLDKDHDDSAVHGRPLSIMNSFIIQSEHYKAYRNEYLDNLFSKKAVEVVSNCTVLGH